MAKEIRHVQGELKPHEYQELKRAAEKRGITLKEAAREALLEWVRSESGFDPGDPLFETVGMFSSMKSLATKHDEIYEG